MKKTLSIWVELKTLEKIKERARHDEETTSKTASRILEESVEYRNFLLSLRSDLLNVQNILLSTTDPVNGGVLRLREIDTEISKRC
jgi:hypothetical protein